MRARTGHITGAFTFEEREMREAKLSNFTCVFWYTMEAFVNVLSFLSIGFRFSCWCLCFEYQLCSHEVDMPRWLFVESLLNNKNRIQNWLIDGFCVVLESSTNVLSMKAYLPFSLSGFLSKKSFVWSFLWSVCYSNHDTIRIFDSTFKVTPSLQFQKKLQIWI